MRFASAALIVIGYIALGGCGGAPSPPLRPATGPDPEVLAAHSARDSAIARARGLGMDGGPVRRMQDALDAFQRGELDVAYDFLPTPYQQEVDTLIQEFSRNVDPELWQRLFSVLGKAVAVLKVKKSELLSLSSAAEGSELQTRKLAEHWDGMVAALEDIVSSDLVELPRSQALSSRLFLGSKLSPLLREWLALSRDISPSGADPLAELADARVQLIEEHRGSATVRLITANNPEPSPIELLRVDGKWVPRSIVEAWPFGVERVRKHIRELASEGFVSRKPQLQTALDYADHALEAMLKASSASELQAASTPLRVQINLALLEWQSWSQPSGPPKGVLLTIERELSDDEQTRLLARLEQLTDDPDNAIYTATATGGQTIIALRPIYDVARFAERLQFAVSVRTDVSARRVTAKNVNLD